jgi:predicted nucleic acid-binding Zn ribbon protein
MTRGTKPADIGRWEQERERHRLIRNAPPPPDAPSSLSDVVPQVMKELGLADRFWEHALVEEWGSLVGPQVALHARPGRLDRKVLSIFVSHPTWLSELSRYGQKQILENLQKRFGSDKIKSIRLQLDPEDR